MVRLFPSRQTNDNFKEKDRNLFMAQTLHLFPWYSAMRRTEPVAYNSQFDRWSVFGYNDVQRVLSDSATFSSEYMGTNGNPIGASIISTAPPRHRKLRSLVTQAFTPRAI